MRTTPQIIVLNGPPGIGKSTVSAELRRLLAGTVAICGDDLRGFAPPDARAHLGGGATYRAAGALTVAFLNMGAERVLFEYVFLRVSHLRYFRAALPEATAVQMFTLWAPLEIVIARGAQRAPRPGLRSNARDGYSELAQNLPEMGEIVDASAADPRALALRIHELMGHAAAP